MSELESLVAIAFILIAFAVLCYVVGYVDAVKKMKGGGQIESMKKARNEEATSKTSIHKLISRYSLSRMGVKSK
ncbi:excisionase [Listeria monocytogenes]|nr:excisionase [Listeria monocytogenes]